jgi:diguanylate cyclase
MRAANVAQRRAHHSADDRDARSELGRESAQDHWLRIGYAVAAVALISVYPFLSGVGRRVDFFVVSVSAIPALVYAVRRMAPIDRRPWLLLVAAVVIVNCGNLVKLLLGDSGLVAGRLLDATGNALVLVAALALVLRRGHNDIGGIIDATIVALAVGGLLWDVVLLPNLTEDFRGGTAQVHLFVVIFTLSGVLGALGRLVLIGKRPDPALWFLIAALTFALAGDALIALASAAWLQVAAMMMFMAAYASLGLCGLDRTAAQIAQPDPVPHQDGLSVGRLVFLGAAVAVIPLVVGTRALLNGDVDGWLLAIGGVMVTVLVMVRIGHLSAERDRAEEALRHEASHDPLTNLPNRREFLARLADELLLGPGCVIVFCDLNGFKTINDRLGHSAGDLVLVQVSRRLRSCVREEDLVSRVGGDEFVIMFGNTPMAYVEQICNRIADIMARPVNLPGAQVTVSISAGIAVAEQEVDPEHLISSADHAMYLAKNGARKTLGDIHSVPLISRKQPVGR